jgi:hypothetical protein
MSAGQGGGVDQAYDGWRVVSQFEFQQWVESGHSFEPDGMGAPKADIDSRSSEEHKLTPRRALVGGKC